MSKQSGDLSDDEGTGWTPPRSLPLERGPYRAKLIRELAEGIKPNVQLATEYGVTAASISSFKGRHATEIAEQQADFENEFADLWIAQKRLRLAVLQDDIEETADSYEPEVIKIRHAALLQAAKELGQLPSSAGVTVNTPTATFSINGVDLDQLR